MSQFKPEKLSLNQVMRFIDQLPASDREQLRQRLNAEPNPFFDCSIDIEKLAAQQAVPDSPSVERLKGDFWPADEDINEFVQTLRLWRQESSERPTLSR